MRASAARVRDGAGRAGAGARARAPAAAAGRARRCACAGCGRATADAYVLDGVDLDLAPGRRVARRRAQRRRQVDAGRGPAALPGLRGLGDARRRRAARRSTATPRAPTIGLVAQDAHVFDTTLRENLLLARRDATEAELDAALAHARLLEWTATLPAGLDTEGGAGGHRFSGGERRRIALARAELARFPLLILDEPGEHLDAPTADAIVADALARRARHAADHAPARGPGAHGRDRRARGRPRRRARHPLRAAWAAAAATRSPGRARGTRDRSSPGRAGRAGRTRRRRPSSPSARRTPEAAPATVRLYAASVLETRTFGNRSTNSELTVARHGDRGGGERPALAAGAQQRAGGEHGDDGEHAQHGRRPAGEHDHGDQRGHATARTPTARERSRTAPSVFSARNVAPCRTDSASSVSPVQTP